MSERKRGRRRRNQKDDYPNRQERRHEQLIQQLGRRFHTNQPSTSSPSNVDEIPLPSEAPNPFGAPPKLTEKDYGIDYMNDQPVCSTHSAELMRSTRDVFRAEEAEIYLLNRVQATRDTVLGEFRSRILEPLRKKRALQTQVPYVEFPYHSMTNRHRDEDEEEEKEEEEESSSSESSDGQPSTSSGRTRKRREQRKAATRRKMEEKERQATLLRAAIDRKRHHPNGIHSDIPFNERNLGNEGPECRCPPPLQTSGVKHGYYAGENRVVDCTRTNGSNLHYYLLRVTPAPNDGQFSRTQMMISGDTFSFEGFTLITHSPLPDCMTRRPICKYGMDYEFQLVEELIPDGCFDPEECDVLSKFIFHEIFEMFNFELRPKHLPDSIVSCPMIHVMPRFEASRDGATWLWSTKSTLAWFLARGETPNVFEDLDERNMSKWKQAIILNSQRKPSAIRADSFERDPDTREMFFVHNAIRNGAFPGAARVTALEVAINKMKQEKRITGVPHPDYDASRLELEKLKEEAKAMRCLRLRAPLTGYIDTGLRPDVVAHVTMAIVACHHIRYNFSISVIEELIEYQFNDRRIIELAFMHSSFRSSYGTPIDHIKTIVANCGYRRKYGTEEKREKKKGIVSLFNIMGGDTGGEPILHNERLEFLGDAVVELIVSHHLFFMLSHHLEGGLATYRTALVQNRNLAKLSKNCRFDEMLQSAHGADLINEADHKHALANAFEAVLAAVYLDGGLAPCDVIFSKAMYGDNPEAKRVWDHHNEHELKREDPLGDRELSMITPALAAFHPLEKSLGVQFNNIRLLAKAFTRRNVPNNDLTKGHNQRLEWLGDSVLQLLISDYLYRRFPNHHEGHMSLLRTSLVSNQTQSYVCDDLGFAAYVIKPPHRVPELKVKDKADLVEAFIGALYVDSGIEHCRAFVRMVFCPRLKHFIESEQWNDAKSHLQQWCLAMRKSRNEAPTMPEYRVLGIEGPTNNRIFKIAVYFRGQRLATATGSNVHKAELKVAEIALAELEATSMLKMKGKDLDSKHRRLRQVFFD
uniref:Ribonuclease 3 n=1 Tax=Caenorhabditis tropicalis TaxID=1561998 RepID=A0A1I7U6F2_9PELO